MPTTQNPAISPIPEGHRSLAPYLYVRGASRAMDFYSTAFGAQELFHMAAPDGRIAHAEMQIGDSILMLANENPAITSTSPDSCRASPTHAVLHALYGQGVCARPIASRG